jgi:hypothetical protein
MAVEGAPIRLWVHNVAMKPRITTAAAFGLGYVLGSTSARRHAAKLLRTSWRVGGTATRTRPAELAAEKARAVARLAGERARDAAGSLLGWRNGEEAADALALDLAADLASALDEHRRSLGLPAGSPGFRPLRDSRGAVAPIRVGAASRGSSPRSA